jgi:cellulose synthase/poly-beta-1,6-N-acetylglucosamine synthase-like glycosyltransferase
VELNNFWIVATVITGSFALLHLLLQVLWFSKLAFFKPSPPQPCPYEGVSVIVVARNEHDNLIHLLPILLEQNYPVEYEVIVANDNSTDDTFWLLKTAAQAFDHLKVVTVNHTPAGIHPKKYAITLAVKAARYEKLILTDADCRPSSSNWLASIASRFNDKQIVLGYSPYMIRSGFLNRLIRYETLYTAMQYLSSALWGHPYMGVGRNLAYTKNLFLNNKGFHKFQRVVGGDDDLFINSVATAQNTTVAIGTDTLVHSLPKTTWREWWQQKRRHLSVGKYYHWKDRLWLGLNAILGMITHLLIWGGLVASLIWQQWLPAGIITGIILLRWGFLGTIAYLCAKQLDDRFNIIWWPLLDFFHTIYYFTAGLSVLISKKVEWK